MTDLPTTRPDPASIIARVKNILLTPKTEWERIEAEGGSIKGIYLGYVCILAAIGPIASLIGGQLFPVGAFGFSYRPPIIGAVVAAVIGYIAALAGVFITALVIDALAPTFGGQKDQLKAFKVAAYSSTAAWIAGIFGIFPMLAWLAFVGLYSLYLFWLGAPKLMKTPEDKSTGFVIVTIIVAIVVNAVVIGIVSTVTAMTAGAAAVGAMSAANPGGGTITVNNGNGTASINLGQMAAAAKAASAQMNAANAAANGNGNVNVKATPAIPGDQLAAMLPPAVAGYPRTDVSSSSGGMGGVQASNATGTYTQGGSTITMKLTDLGGMGAMAGMAAAFGVNSNEQHGTSYEKVNTANGVMTSEKYDTATKNGSFGVVKGRFAVEAEGTNVDINTLKGAVAAVSIDAMAAKAPH